MKEVIHMRLLKMIQCWEQWHLPLFAGTQEAETRGALEYRSSKPAQAISKKKKAAAAEEERTQMSTSICFKPHINT